MKLLKKITYSEIFKNYLSVFIIFFFMNNLIALGSEQKSFSVKSNRVDIEFEKTFFENSISYISYDNLENQLKTFFGKFSDQSENILYPDISIINSSDLLRELYKTKLNDMAINEINYNMNK